MSCATVALLAEQFKDVASLPVATMSNVVPDPDPVSTPRHASVPTEKPRPTTPTSRSESHVLVEHA